MKYRKKTTNGHGPIWAQNLTKLMIQLKKFPFQLKQLSVHSSDGMVALVLSLSKKNRYTTVSEMISQMYGAIEISMNFLLIHLIWHQTLSIQ